MEFEEINTYNKRQHVIAPHPGTVVFRQVVAERNLHALRNPHALCYLALQSGGGVRPLLRVAPYYEALPEGGVAEAGGTHLRVAQGAGGASGRRRNHQGALTGTAPQDHRPQDAAYIPLSLRGSPSAPAQGQTHHHAVTPSTHFAVSAYSSKGI
jgi:hypothetical protein